MTVAMKNAMSSVQVWVLRCAFAYSLAAILPLSSPAQRVGQGHQDQAEPGGSAAKTPSATNKPEPVANSDWQNYGNDPGGMRYSSLAQINKDNVSQLKVAWTYHTGVPWSSWAT